VIFVTSSTAELIYKGALKNIVMRTTIREIAFMSANLPRNLPALQCKASLNEAGEIAICSFNTKLNSRLLTIPLSPLQEKARLL
jgi:hypothetical protein